jgi:hypothetical protein
MTVVGGFLGVPPSFENADDTLAVELVANLPHLLTEAMRTRSGTLHAKEYLT